MDVMFSAPAAWARTKERQRGEEIGYHSPHVNTDTCDLLLAVCGLSFLAVYVFIWLVHFPSPDISFNSLYQLFWRSQVYAPLSFVL